MKKRFITIADYDFENHVSVEKSHEFPSVAEPGLAYTVEEMLRKNFAGELFDPGYRNKLLFPGESDGFNPEDVARMDQIDRAEWSKRTLDAAEKQSKAAQELQAKNEAEAKKARQERAKAKREAIKAEVLAEMGLSRASKTPVETQNPSEAAPT